MASPFLGIVRRANRWTRRRRRLRRVGVAVYGTALRLNVFLGPPRVLLNGPAKAGTHLLSDCLSLLPRMTFSGRHFTPDEFARTDPGRDPVPDLDVERLTRYLRRCPQGMFVTTHAGYQSALAETVGELGFRHVLLLRDPRDMAVSLVHFIVGGDWLPRHRYFNDALRSFDDRLLAVIRGYEDGQAWLPSVATVLDTYIPWLDRPDVLVCRFEDLVGPRGGGSADVQRAEIVRIAAFVDRPIGDDVAGQVAERMYSSSGLTFREGRAGGWRDSFSAEHRAVFKEVAGSQLVALGYERDLAW